MEAEYPNSFGYNPRPFPASMTSFRLKIQIMSAINSFSWVPYLGASTPKFGYPPPQKKMQAFNCPRVFFSPKFNKSSPNILSLQETLIKTMDKVSRNSTQVWYSISIIITKILPIMITNNIMRHCATPN